MTGHKNIRNLHASVFDHMLKTRGWKYRAFIRYLHLFKYAAFAPVRGSFLESYYVLMRYLDDVVDGDAPLPQGFDNESEYILQKIAFSKDPTKPVDEIDHLMVHCFELADRFGENFYEETQDILQSLLFDANRRGKLIIFPKQNLEDHFHKLDIRGTIRATLKVFKEDPDKYKILEPLGMASRYQYDLEDFETDIAAGYVNISKEECDKFGIRKKDLKDISSPGVQEWLHQRAVDGMALLKEHHRRLPDGNFSLLARATFPLVYENPAKKVFLHTIAKYRYKQTV